MDTISSNLDTLVKEELGIQEHVKWIGSPNPHDAKLSGFKLYFFAIPVMLFCVIGARYVEAELSESYESYIGVLGMLLIILVICIFSFFAPWTEYLKAKKTVYVITNLRIFIIEMNKTINIKNYYPYLIRVFEKNTKSDGSGDLVFTFESHLDSDDIAVTEKIGFKSVNNVNEAEKCINQLIEQSESIRAKWNADWKALHHYKLQVNTVETKSSILSILIQVLLSGVVIYLIAWIIYLYFVGAFSS